MIEDGPRTFAGIVRFLQYIKGPDHWHNVGDTGEPAFENSWVNFGSPYQVARYIKDAAGVVHIEGLVKSGSLPATAFVLPPGYRPSATLYIPEVANGVSISLIVVENDGDVIINTGSATWNSLFCSFYVG